jgi:hypothetical protein
VGNFFEDHTQTTSPKKKYFAKRQEGARKDVERAFEVLQSRFAIVRGPAKEWKHKEIGDVMKACVIMHNMIVEEEQDTGRQNYTYEAMGERVIVEHIDEPLGALFCLTIVYMALHDHFHEPLEMPLQALNDLCSCSVLNVLDKLYLVC